MEHLRIEKRHLTAALAIGIGWPAAAEAVARIIQALG